MKKDFIVFLDIDGVLNYRDFFKSKRYQENPGPQYDPSRMINRYNLRLVGMLCRITGAKVVMSSSWRYGWNPDGSVRIDKDGHTEELTDKLLREYGVKVSSITGTKIEKLQGEYELDENIVSSYVDKPTIRGLAMTRDSFLEYARGSQIIDWIERNSFTGDYVILEDDWKDVTVYTMLKKHLVITSFYKKYGGFRCKHLLKCLIHYWFNK